MNELKWLGYKRGVIELRIESLRDWIKKICTEEENDNNDMKKYRKLERDKFEIEIWDHNNKITQIENRINALEKDSNLAKKSNEIFMGKYKTLEHREKNFLERWLASSLPGEEVFTADYSLLDLDQQKRLKKFEMYHWDVEDLSWFDKIGKHWGKGKQHAIELAQLQDELSFFEKKNLYEKSIGKQVELLMKGYPHETFVSSCLRSIALHYVELKKFILALKVLDKYLTLFPDDDEVVLLKQDVQTSFSLNKDFHEIRAAHLDDKGVLFKYQISISLDKDFPEIRVAHSDTEHDLQLKTRPTLMIVSKQDDYYEFLKKRALVLNNTYHGRFLSPYKEKVLSKPNITSWSNLGFAYLQKGLFEEAAHSFIKTTQLGTKNQNLWIWAAGALVEAEKYQEAIDLYKQMLPIIDINFFESFLFHVFYFFETIITQNPNNSKSLSGIKEIYSLSRTKISNDTKLKHFLKILDTCEESIDKNLKKMKKE